MVIWRVDITPASVLVAECVDIPEPDYSDSDEDDLLRPPADNEVNDEIESELISARKLVNPCLESKQHRALRRELALNHKLYVRKLANLSRCNNNTYTPCLKKTVLVLFFE